MALLLLLNMAMASGAKVRPFVFPDPNTIVPEVEGINTFERLSPVATTTKHVVDVWFHHIAFPVSIGFWVHIVI
eukprot:1354174-Amorphochlora_amoeboformis.AAC.1